MQIIPVDESKGEFFKILATTDKIQVGVMTLEPGGDSGPEDIHTGEQIIYIIEGNARLMVNGKEIHIKKGEAFIIPTKAQHHIYNDLPAPRARQAGGTKILFFLTMYAPPQY